MQLNRLKTWCLAGLWAWTAMAPVAADPAYPSKPIRIQVGAGPGSGSDLTARYLGAKLAELAKQSVVVENKAGAAGLLATESVGLNGGDPYQVLWVSGTIVSSYLTNPNMKVDVFKDLEPLIQVGDSQLLLLVKKSLPVNTYQELMALFRQDPGKYNFGSTGMGGATHLYMEEMSASENIRLTHVPYKGTGQALNALMGGEIDIMFSTQSIAGAPIRAGQIKALAITGHKRAVGLPDVPTFKEAGNTVFNATMLSGFMVNAKVDPAVTAKLNGWLNTVLAMKDVQERLELYDMTIKGGSGAQFRQTLIDEMHKQKGLLSKVELK
jgi:tripartite-type tricarboxylate transporter receptor subunit TctC